MVEPVNIGRALALPTALALDFADSVQDELGDFGGAFGAELRVDGVINHGRNTPSGHDIGAFAFIGAGAVVAKTVPEYVLAVGNPARQIGWMSEYGHRLEFDNKGLAECPESYDEYKLTNNQVQKILKE